MKQEETIKQFLDRPWEPWLHRRFDPLVTYMMVSHATKEAFKSEGIDGYFPIAFYDTLDWYSCDEMFDTAAKQAEQYLKKKDIFTLTRQCENILHTGRKKIPDIYQNVKDPVEAYKQAIEIIAPANVYIFVAHGAEAYYYKKIRTALQSLFRPDDIEKIIGDISYPSKKNSLALMDEDIRSGVSLEELHKKYAWIKARGGFNDGYTIEEMKKILEETLSEEKEEFQHNIELPNELMPLVKELQELVYLRTLRTDALYELYYLARPIFHAVETHYDIDSVKDYLPEDIISGDLDEIPHNYAMIKYDDGVIVTNSVIAQKNVDAQEVRGSVAQLGSAKGTVKIVLQPSEIDKVKKGDILVTNMTIPAYISAMSRAAAFVTDEGGITCHAAIIAREMKKPCVIGTKHATKVFKDGDIIEVDAENGIVRKV